jgi:hypothetical protein
VILNGEWVEWKKTLKIWKEKALQENPERSQNRTLRKDFRFLKWKRAPLSS